MEKEVAFDYDAVFEVDDYMYFYSEFLDDERSQSEVDALVELLALEQPQRILDLACGFGRHANLLAARGHQVVGVDLYAGYLEIARKNALEWGVQVDYRQADMRHLDLEEEFDLVLMVFTVFGYFTDKVNLRVLENAARALKPGGRLVFDSPNRDVVLKDFRPHHVTEKEGNLMIDRNHFDSITGRLYNRRIVIRDGVRRDKPFFVRLYNPSEILELLNKVGLGLETLLGGYDGQPVSPDSRRMVVVAKKP
jgi:SAM-dependent methyltransferase